MNLELALATALSLASGQVASTPQSQPAPLASDPAAAIAPQRPQAPARQAKPDRRFRLSISLSLGGAYLGDVPVETTTAGDVSIDVARLVELLRPVVTQAVVGNLLARAAGAELAPIEILSGSDVSLSYDSATLALTVTLPSDSRALNRVSIVNPSQASGANVTAPSDRAFGITFALNTQLVHDGFDDVDRGPVEVTARGFGNVGGVDGLYLAFEAGFSEDEDFARRRTTLFYDDVSRAIRYSLGDVAPQTLGVYDAQLNMAGLTVERLYETIQPYRNVRPSGRGGLTLESESRVDVVVNGVVQQTLRLGPGRYDLRDFPFLSGYNDVRLVVEDNSGRREVGAVSFFSDAELLDPGISIFSASLGARERSAGLFDSPEYEDELTFSGFYQRGFSDQITLGVAGQVDRNNGLIALQGAYATRFGVFGAQAAVDTDQDSDTEHALLLTWRYTATSKGGGSAGWQVEFESLSEGFSPMSASGTAFNANSWEIDARYQTDLAYGVFATFGAGYSRSRGDLEDQSRASAALSRSFGRFSASLGLEHREGGFADEDRATLSLSLPVGARSSARLRADTGRDEVIAEFDRRAFNSLDQLGYRVAVGDNRDGPIVNAELEYYGNRFRGRLTHDYLKTGDQVTQITNAGLTFGVGFADSRVALGREADRGFVIVDKHRTLGDAVVVARNRSSLGDSARTGALGPALVPLDRGYALDSVEVGVEGAPPGYDIGAGRIDIVPGAASGYRMLIGSAASNTVVGVLLDAEGQGVPFLAGTLTPLAGKDAVETQFFTNRTGRLVAQHVAPGRYALTPFGGTESIGEVVVPDDATGTVNIGTLTYRGGKP